MNEHTPGPWEVEDVPGANLRILAVIGSVQPIYNVPIKPSVVVGNDGKLFMHLAFDDWRQFPSEDFCAAQKANARLIAAAPELLAACKAALSFAGHAADVDDWCGCDDCRVEWEGVTKQLEAALARVEAPTPAKEAP